MGQIGGTIYEAAAHGQYCYTGMGSRLIILNISDPRHPVLVGQTDPLPDLILGITAAGSYAYVAGAGSGHRSWELQFSSDPTFTSISLRIRGFGTKTEWGMRQNQWKRILSLAEQQKGLLYWRVVATRSDRSLVTSEPSWFTVREARPLSHPTISPIQVDAPPTVSWGNGCQTKCRV